MPSDPTGPILTAALARLAAAGLTVPGTSDPLPIANAPPSGQSVPHLVVRVAVSEGRRSGDLTVDCYSTHSGDKQALDLLALAGNALHERVLISNGTTWVYARHNDTDVTPEEDGALRVGTAVFSLIIEQWS